MYGTLTTVPGPLPNETAGPYFFFSNAVIERTFCPAKNEELVQFICHVSWQATETVY